MKLTDIIKTANQNLLRNKLRTFLTILAIFIGSFTIILNSAINTGVNAFIDQQVANYGGEGYLAIASSEVSEELTTSSAMASGAIREYNENKGSLSVAYISDEDITKIRELDGVKSVSPLKSLQVEYITSDRTDKKYQITNIQSLASDTIKIDMATGRNVDLNSSELEIILPPDYATTLGFDSDEAIIGEEVTIAVPEQLKCQMAKDTKSCLSTVKATVVGIQAPGVISTSTAWVNTALEEKIYNIYTNNLPDDIKNRTLALAADVDPAKVSEVKQQLEEMGYTGLDVNDIVGMIKTFFDVILIILSIFGGIALLAAAIGIINTLFMSVQERTREIGLMKALGLSDAKVFLSFSFEAISLGFWGSIIGIGLSMLIGNIANTIAHETFLSSFPTFDLVKFDPLNMLLITLLIMLIAFLAGTLPALKAAKKDPIEALRYE